VGGPLSRATPHRLLQSLAMAILDVRLPRRVQPLELGAISNTAAISGILP
jgi:hypothetical protein